ncbi:MAG TPA: patatin-like phospholipase family protein [Candidatus Limnocylindrales bacterium]|nr:patatin-like phospholipase family protein [Candidatus Limnocylindrales bacterium]
MLGLVMTAGGARGAYQAGVLKRIAEIPAFADAPSPFAIITGASAGAINGSVLAARSAHFADAAEDVARVWSQLRVEQVIRADAWSLLRTGLSLTSDFVLGSVFGHTVTHGLFDTTPLETMLRAVFPPKGIGESIQRGHLYAVAMTATSYHSGRSFTFIQGREGHPVWSKSRRVVLPVTLTHRHVLASAAIPIVFPPVQVSLREGDLWFGDGALRLVAPLSPAIRLGATRILALGVRSKKSADTLAQEEAGTACRIGGGGGGPELPCPPLAQICGVFMNAIFLDHLDADVEHLLRMNELLADRPGFTSLVATQEAGGKPLEPMKRIEPLVLSPSEDLALVAQRFVHRIPRLVRLVLDGLGFPDAQSADLTSYLLFDSTYTRTLVDIGYRDASACIDELEHFLRTAPVLAPPSQQPKARRLWAVTSDRVAEGEDIEPGAM